MSDTPPNTETEPKGRNWGWLILGCIVFGILMGERGEFQSHWVRSLVAGCAAAFLAFCISRSRK